MRRGAILFLVFGLVAAMVPVAGPAQAADPVALERVSLGTRLNDERDDPDISADGRFVAFVSDSSEIVLEDRHHRGSLEDIFLRDVDGETTIRITSDHAGGDPNGRSAQASVSGNGRYVAFSSEASDLILGDGNGQRDIFRRDTLTGTTERVSVDLDGGDAISSSFSPAITSDGRYVAFQSNASDLVPDDANGTIDVFVRDMDLGTTVRVSVGAGGEEGAGQSQLPSISDDGRLVAFASLADNLVSDDSNGASDVFVHNLTTASTERVSVDNTGVEGDDQSTRPSISADGTVVAFVSSATNLASDDDADLQNDIFLRDLESGTTERINVSASSGGDATGTTFMPVVSGNGRYVAFQGSSNDLMTGVTQGIFVRDRQHGTTALASASDSGVPATFGSSLPSISGDGRYVAFDNSSKNLTVEDGATDEDAYRKDMVTGDIVLASPDLEIPLGYFQYGTPSTEPSVSSDGRLVAYTTWDTGVTLGPGDEAEEIALRDRIAGTTIPITVNVEGTNPHGSSWAPALSANGGHAAFLSTAYDLVDGFDPDGVNHVFLRDIGAGTNAAVSLNLGGAPGDGSSSRPSISADGRYVAFASESTDLVADDGNGVADVFVRDMALGLTDRISVDVGGVDPDGASYEPAISSDGRFVVFASDATDLVGDDGNGVTDVFVADLQVGTVARVSVDLLGQDADSYSWAPAISGDSRVVVFQSEALDLVADGPQTRVTNIYVRDLVSGVTELVTEGQSGESDNQSWDPVISGDGRMVVFGSTATNLDPDGVIEDGGYHLYLRDLESQQTTRISVSEPNFGTGIDSEAPAALSFDGRFVAYASELGSLVPNDTNGHMDVFLAEIDLTPAVPECLGLPATLVGSGAITGTTGPDVIVGSDDADVIAGLGGDDVICGGEGDDQIAGDAGADLLAGGPGNDGIAGAGGVDRANFQSSSGSVVVDLVTGTAAGEGADTLTGIESVTGTSHDDTLLGNGSTNALEGGNGADILIGLGGNDTLYGGEGDDSMSGMAGSDLVDGGGGTDLCVQGTGTGVPVACESEVIPISIGDSVVVEPDTGTTAVGFTVSVPIPTDTPITMVASTSDGTAIAGSDYTARSGVAVSIPANQTNRIVNVQARGDYTPEADEIFELVLSGAVGGSLSDDRGIATIQDEDPVESLPVVTITDIEVLETNRANVNVLLTVSLSSPFPAPVTMDYSTERGGTATAGEDYTSLLPTQLRFNPGVTERTIRVTLHGDTLAEQPESIEVQLSRPVNAVLGEEYGWISIIDDDLVPGFTVTPVGVSEGGGTAAFTFELDRPFGVTARVRYATANGSALAGSDYTSSGFVTVRFDPGVTSQIVLVPITNDAVPESEESFTLQFSNPVNLNLGLLAVQGTIADDD